MQRGGMERDRMAREGSVGMVVVAMGARGEGGLAENGCVRVRV